MIDHDRLFKELLTTFFVEFVELFLPDLAAYLDPTSVEFLDKEVFTDVTSGDKHEVDLVAKTRFQGKGAFFLVHVEQQATVQEPFSERMFDYFSRLHRKYRLRVYPIALFTYDAPQREEPDRYLVEFPGWVVNDFHFRVIQLNQLDWRDFVRHPNPVAAALMAKMRIAPGDRPKVKLECLRLLATLRLDPARMQLISGFVDTYLRLNAEEQQVFEEELGAVEPPEQEEMMEIVTSWMEEGLERGRREGLEQGLEQGGRTEALKIVSLLLDYKVGPLEPGVKERIAALSTDQLEELGKALLDFESVADLAAWLDRTT